MKLNPIPPTLKDNHRYIVFEIISGCDILFEDVVNAIWSSSMQMFGEVGTSKLRLWIPSAFFDKDRKRGLIRTTNSSVEEARAAIAAIREIAGVKVIFYVLGVTGTIKSARSKFFGIQDLSDFEVGTADGTEGSNA